MRNCIRWPVVTPFLWFCVGWIGAFLYKVLLAIEIVVLREVSKYSKWSPLNISGPLLNPDRLLAMPFCTRRTRGMLLARRFPLVKNIQEDYIRSTFPFILKESQQMNFKVYRFHGSPHYDHLRVIKDVCCFSVFRITRCFSAHTFFFVPLTAVRITKNVTTRCQDGYWVVLLYN